MEHSEMEVKAEEGSVLQIIHSNVEFDDGSDAAVQSNGVVINELLCTLQYFDSESDSNLEDCLTTHFSSADVLDAHMLLDNLCAELQCETPLEEPVEEIQAADPDGKLGLGKLAYRLRRLTEDDSFPCVFVARDLSRVITPAELLLQSEYKDLDVPIKRPTGRPRNSAKRVRPKVSDSPPDSPTTPLGPVSQRGRKRKLTTKAAEQGETEDLIKQEVMSDGEEEMKPEIKKKPKGRRGRPKGDGESYSKHGILDTETGLYRCNQCNKAFEMIVALKRHWLTHEARKRNVCSVCNKTFTSTGGLRDHMMIHTGEKPHQCTTCDARFRLRCDWERHLRTHTKARPYMCHVCGKCFSTSNVLAIHRRTHTGETPYTCQYCGQPFIRLTALKNHEHIHTGARPYKCKICGKSYGNGGTYWHHQQLHKKEQQQQHMLRAALETSQQQETQAAAATQPVMSTGATQLQFDTMVAVAEMVAAAPQLAVLADGTISHGVIAQNDVITTEGGEVIATEIAEGAGVITTEGVIAADGSVITEGSVIDGALAQAATVIAEAQAPQHDGAAADQKVEMIQLVGADNQTTTAAVQYQ